VPGLLLQYINSRAKKALTGEDPNLSENQIEAELDVLGLKWSTKLEMGFFPGWATRVPSMPKASVRRRYVQKF